MNKYRIESSACRLHSKNPNSNNELDYKSSSTLRTNPARRKNVAYTIHSHSENQDDGGFGLAIPSQKDKNSFIGTTKIGVVLGYQEGQVKNSITGKTGLNKTIGFFTKEGSILNEPKSFSDFKTAIYKINKQ